MTPTVAITPTATATTMATTTAMPTATPTPTPVPPSSDGRGRPLLSPADWPTWGWPLAGGGLLALLFVTWLVVRFVHYTGTDLRMKQRMVGESETTRLEERRREVEELLVSQDAWLRVVSQVVADTLDRPVRIDTQMPPRVSGRPVPYFTVTDEGGTHYVLTTDPRAMQEVGLLKKRVKPARLQSAVEPGLVWTHLAEKHLRSAGDVVPAVPRDASWFLVVVEAER